MPLLSIITVCLNNKAGLEKTILSIINQSFSDYEFIVIDGGSTDGSVDVIKKYSDRISIWISEKDNGVYNAMNKGIKFATGLYCQFLNSGDVLFAPTTLRGVFNHKHTEDLLYGNMVIDFMNGTKQEGKMPSGISRKHMMRDTLWHPVSFIKRDLFFVLGTYNEKFSIASDYDFFLKAILVNKVSMFYLDKTIAIFAHDGMSSLPDNREKLLAERRNIQRQYFSDKKIESALRFSFSEKVIRKLKSWLK